MKQLSPEAFAQAREFLKNQARPLERALFEYHFERWTPEQVVAELVLYQNDDGGFGHGLEADVRTPYSSALATSWALRILVEVGVTAASPIVGSSLRYLAATYDKEKQVWRVVPPETNLSPHAPWWHDEGGSLERTFGNFIIIPRVQIVASLQTYAALVPADWLDDLTEQVVRDVEATDPLGEGGGSDLQYAIELAETKELRRPFKDRLVRRIRHSVPQVINRDPEQWRTYTLTPLRAAPTPTSVAADLIRDEVQAYLDFLIDQQRPEGNWEPNWSWGPFFPEEQAKAMQEWRGVLTLEALRALKAYGRLEND